MDAGEPWDRSSGPPFSSPGVSGLAPRRGQAPGPPRPGPAKGHLAAVRSRDQRFTLQPQTRLGVTRRTRPLTSSRDHRRLAKLDLFGISSTIGTILSISLVFSQNSGHSPPVAI